MSYRHIIPVQHRAQLSAGPGLKTDACRKPLSVLAPSPVELFFDRFFQRLGCNHFHLRTMLQDVHDELGVVRVGNTEFIATVVEPARLLLRVPGFVGHPASTICAKAQDGGGDGLAGEDAVSAGKFAVEGRVRHVPGHFRQHARMADTLHGKNAQGFFPVAPGIEVPVVAIVGKPLRGDFARAGLVALTVVIFYKEPLALQDGAGRGLEVVQVCCASRHGQDADALLRLAAAQVFRLQDALQAGADRRKQMVQQAGLERLQQVIEADEGMQFFAGEPQAGQFEATVRRVETVAAMFLVEDKGSAEFFAQVGDKAGEFGAGNFQFVQQRLAADRGAPAVQQAVQSVEVVKSAHLASSISSPEPRSQRDAHHDDSVLQYPLRGKLADGPYRMARLTARVFRRSGN